jgi:hypothetical protein
VRAKKQGLEVYIRHVLRTLILCPNGRTALFCTNDLQG